MVPGEECVGDTMTHLGIGAMGEVYREAPSG